MILGDRYRAQAPADGEPPPTVDDLFRRALARRPDAVALIDPPNRAAVTDGPPRRLTFAEADRIVTAIAARLRELGLPTDSIVAMQLPNTVESVLTLLGVLRAGLIAAPLPLLWRQADAVTALGRIGARALVTCQRIGRVDHGEIAMQVAAETFQIRFVGAYGDKPADGLFPLDDLMRGEPVAFEPPERAGQAADHLAVVTFDVTGDGIVPVARSHAELLAAGLAVVLEGRIEQDAVILGALATASLAGLATMVVPWLHSGGTLALHHPFAPAAFAESRAGARCTVAAVPGPLALRLMEAGLLGGRYSLKAVIAAWRTPERMAGFVWPNGGTSLIDVPVFGEIGLVPGRRNAGAKPAELPSGRVTTPRGAADAPALVELVRLATGSLAMRGAMVPKHAFPPGAARAGTPHLEIADDGFVDTGYACRSDKETRALMVDGPPSGIVSVGGYRFVLRELQDLVARIEEEATLAALPDSFAGHRLAGVARNRELIRQALIGLGANPLIVSAFRDRRAADRASAA